MLGESKSVLCSVVWTEQHFRQRGKRNEKDQKLEKCWHFHGSERISVGIEPGVWKER